MGIEEFFDLCWEILGQLEDNDEIPSNSMSDALQVAYAVSHQDVTDYASYKALYP